MIRIALIGLGNMGKLHLKNILKLESEKICKLTCICDNNKEVTDEFVKKLKVNAYYSVEDMIKDDKFDAAIIATTSSEHFFIAKLLINNNKPVLIEKPIVVSLSQAEELYKLSKEKKVLISAGYTEVYNSTTIGVKKYLNDHKGFSIIDFYRIGQKSKRNDTKDIDVIQDLMTHDLAVLSEIIDLNKIVDIQGNISSYNKNSNKYDISNISVMFDNGSIARFLCDRGGSIKIRKFNISNDEVFGEFDFMNQTANIMKKGNIEAFGENIWYSQNYDMIKIRYSNNPLYDEILDFILAVKNNTETKVSKKWFDITETIERIRNTVEKLI